MDDDDDEEEDEYKPEDDDDSPKRRPARQQERRQPARKTPDNTVNLKINILPVLYESQLSSLLFKSYKNFKFQNYVLISRYQKPNRDQ